MEASEEDDQMLDVGDAPNLSSLGGEGPATILPGIDNIILFAAVAGVAVLCIVCVSLAIVFACRKRGSKTDNELGDVSLHGRAGAASRRFDEMQSFRMEAPTAGDASSREWRIDESEIELGAEIGKGAFGVVRKGRWRAMDVAVKHLHGHVFDQVGK